MFLIVTRPNYVINKAIPLEIWARQLYISSREVVSRYRDPQLQVNKNDLKNKLQNIYVPQNLKIFHF